MSSYGIPIILKEGTKTESGNKALSENIAAIRAISEAVKTTFGPSGLNKMIVDSIGDVTVTNDCFTILDEIEVEHPAAKMVIDLAKSMNKDMGDGITKSMIFTGDLLKIGKELLEQKIHPNVVISGYTKALKKAIEIIDSESKKIDINNKEILNKIALTALNSKSTYGARSELGKIAIESISKITDKRGIDNVVDLDLIQIIKKEGEQLHNSVSVDGIIVDKEVVNSTMPKIIKNAKIALINQSLEVTKTEFDTDIQIMDPNQIVALKQQEESMLKNMVELIKDSGANVIFCQKGIDDLAQHYLAKYNIMAIRRVKRSDLTKLMKATHAKIMNDIKSINSNDLGSAEIVQERNVGKDKMIFVEKCKSANSVSILLRGGTRHIVEDAERSIKNSLSVLKNVIEDNTIISGAGAIEIEIAKKLRKYASSISSKQSIVIKNYANVLESIPQTLASNNGLEPMKIIAELNSKHEQKKDSSNFGINLFSNNVENVFEKGIIEPAIILKHALSSSTELSQMIFRVDKVIAVAPNSTGPQMPGQNGPDFD